MKLLRRYDLSFAGAQACREMLLTLNVPDRELLSERATIKAFIESIMATRPGLDQAKVTDMVFDILRAED